MTKFEIKTTITLEIEIPYTLRLKDYPDAKTFEEAVKKEEEHLLDPENKFIALGMAHNAGEVKKVKIKKES